MGVSDLLISKGFRLIRVHADRMPKKKGYQLDDHVQEEMDDRLMFGIVTGKHSNNLECLDVDLKVYKTEAQKTRLKKNLHEAFLKVNPNYQKYVGIYVSMSGGLHILYHANNCGKNQKLCLPFGVDTKEAVIETRANGGYVICYHLRHVYGLKYDTLITITDEMRNAFIEACISVGIPCKKKVETVYKPKALDSSLPTFKGESIVDQIKQNVRIEDVICDNYEVMNADSKGNHSIIRYGKKSQSSTSGTIFNKPNGKQVLWLFTTGDPNDLPSEKSLDVINILAIKENKTEVQIIRDFRQAIK